MQIISGLGLSIDDFLAIDHTGQQIAEFCIAYTVFEHKRISEVILPTSFYAEATNSPNHLILEMSPQLWHACEKKPFSQILPWVVGVPPLWTKLRVRCASSNRRHIIYVPLYILPGTFSTKNGVNRFRIADNLDINSPTADLLIRHHYGDVLRYHGITTKQAVANGAEIFQSLLNASAQPAQGVEYWILRHPAQCLSTLPSPNNHHPYYHTSKYPQISLLL